MFIEHSLMVYFTNKINELNKMNKKSKILEIYFLQMKKTSYMPNGK